MRICFYANMPNFIEPVIKSLSSDDDIGTNSGNHYSIFINGTEAQFMSGLQTADVLWFEWCNDLILFAQRAMKNTPARVICRLHSYEAFSEYPFQVDWTRVDDLILVNESVRDILRMVGVYERIEKAGTKVHIIPNAIECRKYNMSDGEGKALQNPPKIACLGHVNYKKDSSMIFPIAEYLMLKGLPIDIYIGGEIQDLRYKLTFDKYFEPGPRNSMNRVFLDGFQKDVNRWLQDKMFILNTSLFESFNYAIAEGMLCGCIPLIRNWHGSENVYPNVKTWTTMDDLYRIIKEHLFIMSPEELRNTQIANREFIIKNYDIEEVIKQIKPLISTK